MPRMPATSTLAVFSALLAAPVLAQQSAAPAAAPGAPSAAVPGAAVPPPETAAPAVVPGRLQQTHGGWRSSRIVGATVYNDSDQGIGTVDDLIVGPDGKVSTAVISVGGFLGIGSKLVGVPYDQLRFEERKLNDTAAAAIAPPGTAPAPVAAPGAAPTAGAPNGTAVRTPPGTAAGNVPAGAATTGLASPAMPGPNVATTRIVLPGASKDSLTSMPAFSYGSA